jgi:cysteinyl-tRNA synthetase
LGNFFTVRDLLGIAPGETLRFALLQAHYRQPLDFSRDALLKAKQTLDGWYSALRNTAHIPIDKMVDAPPEFLAALADDLNTPQAFAILHDWVGQLNKSPGSKTKSALLRAANLIGFLTQDAEQWLRWVPVGGDAMGEDKINALILARKDAKAAKNFAQADAIRNELLTAGVILEDRADGTIWRRG